MEGDGPPGRIATMYTLIAPDYRPGAHGDSATALFATEAEAHAMARVLNAGIYTITAPNGDVTDWEWDGVGAPRAYATRLAHAYHVASLTAPALGDSYPTYSAALAECERRERLIPGTLWGVEPVTPRPAGPVPVSHVMGRAPYRPTYGQGAPGRGFELGAL